MKLQCVARIDKIPSATRDTSMSVYITSMAEVKKQKFVNQMSTGKNYFILFYYFYINYLKWFSAINLIKYFPIKKKKTPRKQLQPIH